jgi:5-dehydro-2-deoxygluconokinase
MGRIGVDLYPEQIGVPLAEVRTFAKSLGGSPTNVAVGVARYGHRSAVITKVGDDGFGVYARRALQEFGVDDRYVGTDPTLRTPLVFCEIYPPDRFPLLFYRQPTAPDINLRPEELDYEAIRGARIFWTTGTGLSDEPSRSATIAALEARGRSGITVHDLDYRPMLWPDPGVAAEQQKHALVQATVAVGNQEEVSVAVGDGEPEELGRRLLDTGVELAIVKLGPAGVLVARDGEMERVAAVPVEVVCGVGAGDGFGAGLCHGLLAGWDTLRVIRFASAAGAHVASQLACADAMPNEEQVLALMGDA